MEIYHVLNRGVDKRNIFVNDKDYLRFIHDLFEFNDEDYVPDSFSRNFKKDTGKLFSQEKKKRKLLVYIHCFVLMPNHYHLLITPLRQDGLSKFMHKLNKGYSRYFNEKYGRSGALFESRYKKILVKNEEYLIHLPYYIHLNPLDLIAPEWRERELKNFDKAIEFLEKYRWSSHLDYLEIKNFPSVIYKNFLLELFEDVGGYKNAVYSWLRDLNLTTLKDILLE